MDVGCWMEVDVVWMLVEDERWLKLEGKWSLKADVG